MSDSGLPLPHDLPRLHTIRAWLEQQQSQHEVIATYLALATQQVETAIAAAEAAAPGFRLQRHRLTGRCFLHRSDCWITRTGPELSREEAAAVAGAVTPCDICAPENDL